MNTVTKRLLTILLAVFLLTYVGYQIFLVMYSSVEIQTVTAYTAYETLDVDGFAIRSEQVLNQATDGSNKPVTWVYFNQSSRAARRWR